MLSPLGELPASLWADIGVFLGKRKADMPLGRWACPWAGSKAGWSGHGQAGILTFWACSNAYVDGKSTMFVVMFVP